MLGRNDLELEAQCITTLTCDICQHTEKRPKNMLFARFIHEMGNVGWKHHYIKDIIVCPKCCEIVEKGEIKNESSNG